MTTGPVWRDKRWGNLSIRSAALVRSSDSGSNLLRRVLVWVADHELWLLALATPPLVFPEVVPRHLVIAALVYLAGLWVCRWLARGRISVRTPMDIPILGLLAMLPLSLYASVNLSMSLPKLTGVLLGVAVYYAVVNTAQSARDIRRVTFLLVLGGSVVTLVGLLGTDWTGKFPSLGAIYERLPRVITRLPKVHTEGAIHPNELGGTMALFVPFLVSLALGSTNSAFRRDFDPRGRILFQSLMLTTLLLTGLTLLLSQSRSAWIGVALALLFILAVSYPWLRSVLVAGALLAITLTFYFGTVRIGRMLFDVGASTTQVGTLDLAGRVEVWQRAIYMLQDFPYTGIGLNTFSAVANVLYPFFLIGPDTRVPHAHNLLLQTGVDLGIPGLVAFVGLITAFCFVTWRAAHRAQMPYLRAVSFGLLGSMVAYQIFGFTDTITLGAKPGVALWTMLGLAAALHRCSTRP